MKVVEKRSIKIRVRREKEIILRFHSLSFHGSHYEDDNQSDFASKHSFQFNLLKTIIN